MKIFLSVCCGLKRIVCFTLSMISIVGITSSAQAAIITYNFTGRLNGADSAGSFVLPADVHAGATFTGSFSFDSNRPGVEVIPNSFQFNSAITAMTVQIGASTFSQSQIDSLYGANASISQPLTLGNDVFLGMTPGGPQYQDAFAFSDQNTDSSAAARYSVIRLVLLDSKVGSPSTALSSTVLGADQLVLSRFETKSFSYFTQNDANNWESLFGTLTSLELAPAAAVPEPSSVALLGIGCLGLALRGRRSKEQAVA